MHFTCPNRHRAIRTAVVGFVLLIPIAGSLYFALHSRGRLANQPSLSPASKEAAASATGKTNACALLSVEELSSGTGAKYGKSVPETNGANESICSYPPAPGAMYGAKLTVTFRHGKIAMATLQGAGPLLVTGAATGLQLGDASFFLPMDVSIYTLKGDALVVMDFGLIGASREQKVEVLRKVLSRL